MTPKQIELIKATIPILRESGIDLTTHFYENLFNETPELKNIFNMGNQATGKQPHALASSILAYAEHIENPEVLINVLKMIGNKHVSLNISPNQYDTVGKYLLISMKQVLRATDEILDAWAQAYTELASIMISIEQEISLSKLHKKGGWLGWRAFEIMKIVEESNEIKSFYLKPKDGKEIAEYFPGQYLSLKIFIPSLGYEQPRQYSLSSAFSQDYYRISVKKENGNTIGPQGIVSTILHQSQVGREIWVSAPSGNIYHDHSLQTPLVLISGGVGITPLMSILETHQNIGSKNQVIWFHSARSPHVHAFKEKIEKLNRDNTWLTSITFYNEIDHETQEIKRGRINLHDYKEQILIEGAKYYICGPQPFIKAHYEVLVDLGVNKENIFYEEFGPNLLQMI